MAAFWRQGCLPAGDDARRRRCAPVRGVPSTGERVGTL